MPTISVLDGANAPQVINTLPASGPTTKANALPVTMASDETSLVDPALLAYAITPSDATAISVIPRAVRVNVAGTVSFRAVGSGADVAITALAGEVLNVRIQYIRATGTTATGFVGLA